MQVARSCSLLLLVVSLLCALAAFPAAAGASSSSAVQTLTDQNFASLTESGSWLLEFYAPWCGHCKTLAPVFEDAARRLQGSMHLGKIDATVHAGLAEQFGIKGFPTLKFVREGEVRNYQGPRSLEGFLNFGKEMSQPAVSALSAAEFHALPDAHPVSLVFFGSKGGPERRLFDALAFRLQGVVKFFFVDKSQSEVLQAAKVVADETPMLLAVTAHGDHLTPHSAARYAGPWVEAQVREFVMANKLPLVSSLGQENFEEITQSGKKILYAVINPRDAEGSKRFVESLYPLAKEARFREHIVFASLDGLKYNRYVSQFGVSVADAVGQTPANTRALPTVVVLDPELDYYYAPPVRSLPDGTQGSHPIGDAAAVEHFLDEILAGRVSLTGTLPWYNPSRYVKVLEKRLNKLPLWQVVAVVAVPTLALTALLFWCCFAGLDAQEEEQFQKEAQALRQKQAAAQAAAAGKKKKQDASSEQTATSSAEGEDKEGAEGLRARKNKEQQ